MDLADLSGRIGRQARFFQREKKEIIQKEAEKSKNPFKIVNNNTNSSSSSRMDDKALITAKIARLEALQRGDIIDNSRPAKEEFLAANTTKKKGKKSRIMPKACYGLPRCTNALCEHLNVVAYHEPTDVAKENNIIKALLAHCEKQGYPVSELYAKQSLFAREWKIADAWKAIKTNIDEREDKYRLTGRANWDRVNYHADRRPTNPLGAKEPRNERIKYLEDDDASLHDILTNNWNSSYGKDIKQQFPNDKIKQKRQYQLYRREAYYRSERAKFRDSLPLTRTAEENVESMQDFDDINEPQYNLDQLPDEEEAKKAQEALATEPEAEPEAEPETEKPIGPYTKQYNELRAKMIRKGNLPTSGWLPSHGDIQPGHENADETSSSPSAKPLGATAEAIQEEEDSEYVEDYSTASPKTNLPPMPRIRSPFAPSLTIEDLEGMTKHEQQLRFLIRANGRDIMYEKFNALGLSLEDRINCLVHLLKVHETELDETSREALQLEKLKYQSHQERIQAKDYRTVEKLPTDHVVVRFDNHGNEATETEEMRAREAENLMRPAKYPTVQAYESVAEQPGGFMGLGFQREELERILEGMRTSADMTPDELRRGLDGLGKKQEMDVLPKQHFKPQDASYIEMVLNVYSDPAKLKLNFDIPRFVKREVEEAKEAEDAEGQELEAGLSEKAKGKRPIRPWEQNVEYQSDPFDFPSPIMKQKHPKLKKRSQNLFKQISKNTIESKIAEMGYDETVTDMGLVDEPVVLSKKTIESKIADLGLDDEIVAKIVQRLAAKDQSRMSFFTEDFHVPPEYDLNEDDTVNETHDPDAEERDIDGFFADDTTGMDDLQEPFPELDEEPTTCDNQEAETPKFSGATVPPPPPIPEPLDDTDRALQEIAIKTIEITNQFSADERELFKKFISMHSLTASKLSNGPWQEEDVCTFLSFVEDTPAKGISIELICKMLGLCDNNVVRAHAFFKDVIDETTKYFGKIVVRDASWGQYEAVILKWESFYWVVLRMMKEVMEKYGIEWTLW